MGEVRSSAAARQHRGMSTAARQHRGISAAARQDRGMKLFVSFNVDFETFPGFEA